MNKRKLLLVAIALCMVAILAVGGSLAYLTDDETAHNTFTLGDIDINIEEYTWDEKTGWHKWAESELVPLDNEKGFNLNNKIVQTFNTSDSDNAAYIRTIVLFEVNKDLKDTNYQNSDTHCFPGLHYGYRNVAEPTKDSNDITYYGSTAQNQDFTVTIEGVEYHVAVFTEVNGTAIPKNDALYTLSSVWVDKNITSDQIDGWGENVDIKVFSQGIQAEGLTHEEAMAELGELTATNVYNWVTGAKTGAKNDLANKSNVN